MQTTDKLVSMTISLPKGFRDLLRQIAAERNMNNWDDVVSAAQVAREIICEYFDKNPAKTRKGERQ